MSRGPASVPPLADAWFFQWGLGPASRGCVVFPMSRGPASVPPLADAWFFQWSRGPAAVHSMAVIEKIVGCCDKWAKGTSNFSGRGWM